MNRAMLLAWCLGTVRVVRSSERLPPVVPAPPPTLTDTDQLIFECAHTLGSELYAMRIGGLVPITRMETIDLKVLDVYYDALKYNGTLACVIGSLVPFFSPPAYQRFEKLMCPMLDDDDGDVSRESEWRKGALAFRCAPQDRFTLSGPPQHASETVDNARSASAGLFLQQWSPFFVLCPQNGGGWSAQTSILLVPSSQGGDARHFIRHQHPSSAACTHLRALHDPHAQQHEDIGVLGVQSMLRAYGMYCARRLQEDAADAFLVNSFLPFYYSSAVMHGFVSTAIVDQMHTKDSERIVEWALARCTSLLLPSAYMPRPDIADPYGHLFAECVIGIGDGVFRATRDDAGCNSFDAFFDDARAHQRLPSWAKQVASPACRLGAQRASRNMQAWTWF